jgi:O-antigen ligase
MVQVAGSTAPGSPLEYLDIKQQYSLFVFSAFLFRMGLAFETFEQVRPLGIQLSDYFFSFSLLLFLSCRQRRLLRSTGSGVLVAAALVLCGAFLSSANASGLSASAGPLVRLCILFGLFAPLAVVHSKDIRKNLLFLIGGVFTNCVIAILAAWVSPGIADIFAINPVTPTESGQSIGRFQGLAGHSNILGLSAALAVLIAIGLLLSEKGRYARWGLFFNIFVCAVAALLTGSRTFFVCLVPALLVLIILLKLHRRVLLRALVGIFVLWAGLNYVAPELLSQYTSRFSATNADDDENYSRLLTATVAVAEISQKPIFGWGADRFGEAGMVFLPEDEDFMPAHVSFLQYWYGAGLLGAIGFLAIFAIPAKHMLRALATNASGNAVEALGLGLSTYALLFIASNLHPILFNRFLYVPLFMFAGLAAQGPGSIKFSKTARQTVAHSPRNIQGMS